MNRKENNHADRTNRHIIEQINREKKTKPSVISLLLKSSESVFKSLLLTLSRETSAATVYSS